MISNKSWSEYSIIKEVTAGLNASKTKQSKPNTFCFSNKQTLADFDPDMIFVSCYAL